MPEADAAASGGRVSVVLLSYNHAATVGQALRTALDQSVPAAEVIVSDDQSTDGSWELLQEMAAGDPRIRLVRSARNLGMAGNANFAVGHSTRPYVALLHHDDVYRSDMLERWADVLDRHDDIAFVFNRFETNGATSTESFPERTDGPSFLGGRLLRTWGCPVRGTAMIRRSCWDAVGGLDERFGLLADVDLWMRLAARWAVGFVDRPLITVRHERPADYPGDYVRLSFKRNRLLYEVHAANTPAGAARRLRLRAAVSADAAKWLAYAALRRPALLAEAGEGATPLEFAPVRAARALASGLARRRAATA